ncbi:MAG: hypothetical protein JWN00_1139, partial [Actinomycetia bacterium]|nr:hypothetical protein [Actinomycetes bacterium]
PGIPPSCGFLGAWSPAEIGGSPLHVDQATAAAREAEQREYLLSVLRVLESEPSTIGMSQNLVAVAQVPPKA